MIPAPFTLRNWRRLPARERVMLALLFYEKLSPTEVARTLGCTAAEVRRTLELRMRTLRNRRTPRSMPSSDRDAGQRRAA